MSQVAEPFPAKRKNTRDGGTKHQSQVFLNFIKSGVLGSPRKGVFHHIAESQNTKPAYCPLPVCRLVNGIQVGEVQLFKASHQTGAIITAPFGQFLQHLVLLEADAKL